MSAMEILIMPTKDRVRILLLGGNMIESLISDVKFTSINQRRMMFEC